MNKSYRKETDVDRKNGRERPYLSITQGNIVICWILPHNKALQPSSFTPDLEFLEHFYSFSYTKPEENPKLWCWKNSKVPAWNTPQNFPCIILGVPRLSRFSESNPSCHYRTVHVPGSPNLENNRSVVISRIFSWKTYGWKSLKTSLCNVPITILELSCVRLIMWVRGADSCKHTLIIYSRRNDIERTHTNYYSNPSDQSCDQSALPTVFCKYLQYRILPLVN